MNRVQYLFVCTTMCLYLYAVVGQNTLATAKIPRTRFTCVGRAAGYYADMETGCQVYHMCDGLGRQFSYSCPNTTLFQQRMLICDHWYMVNCSMSARDYDANLLIGQRDKPFVSDEEMRQRTPRPDILSVPPNSNYYDGLKEAETKFAVHPGNSIVGVADSISQGENNDLDSAKNFRPPSSWSTRKPTTGFERPQANFDDDDDDDSIAGAASQKPGPTIRPVTDRRPTGSTFNTAIPNITPPSRDLSPPLPPATAESSSEEFQIDARMGEDKEDPVVNFIKRFDPNSPDSIKTSMTKTEILDINKQLPAGQVSSEEERAPKKNKDFNSNFNSVARTDKKSATEGSRFDNVNVKPTQAPERGVSEPSRELVPPKSDYPVIATTTEGPPIYYEWKWAVPAFDLEPPKLSNETNITSNLKTRATQGRNPFRDSPKPTPADIEPTPEPKNTEYNISSYFVPDYVFPLDKAHPGYDNEDAQTSFQVGVSRPGRASYGENPDCPHCHPAYLNPGTCEPCIVKR